MTSWYGCFARQYRLSLWPCMDNLVVLENACHSFHACIFVLPRMSVFFFVCFLLVHWCSCTPPPSPAMTFSFRHLSFQISFVSVPFVADYIRFEVDLTQRFGACPLVIQCYQMLLIRWFFLRQTWKTEALLIVENKSLLASSKDTASFEVVHKSTATIGEFKELLDAVNKKEVFWFHRVHSPYRDHPQLLSIWDVSLCRSALASPIRRFFFNLQSQRNCCVNRGML